MEEFCQILSPCDYDFARFSRRGTWQDAPDSKGVCAECGMSRQTRVPPLLIEWDPDSDIIGDFSWSGFGFELVARLNVAQALVQEFTGFRIESVQMVEPSVGLRRRKKKMVSLPYEGPELCELWIDRWFRLDEKASSLNLERVCGTCGFRFYTPKREGLVLERPTDAPAFFRLEQFPAWVFVSSEVKQHIEATGFTNVAFRDVT